MATDTETSTENLWMGVHGCSSKPTLGVRKDWNARKELLVKGKSREGSTHSYQGQGEREKGRD